MKEIKFEEKYVTLLKLIYELQSQFNKLNLL